MKTDRVWEGRSISVDRLIIVSLRALGLQLELTQSEGEEAARHPSSQCCPPELSCSAREIGLLKLSLPTKGLPAFVKSLFYVVDFE